MSMRMIIPAALLTGAALFLAPSVHAGSCCGGGSGAALVLPKMYRSMIDMSIDLERYNGYWDQRGIHRADPPGSELWQQRLNVGYAHRIASRWQASVSVPLIRNDTTYAGFSSRSLGLGDSSVNLWYEVLDDVSAWKVRNLKDMIPSVLIGPSLLIPTGISPYDDETSSFDVTGRGFYRLDGNVIITKTIDPWNASLALAYGTHLERPVNREYGNAVAPYRKKLGDRTSASVSVGYRWYLGSAGDTLTGAASLARVQEANTTFSGIEEPSSGFRRDSVGGTLTYSSTDHDWSFRIGWNHAVPVDGWGRNFPTTDIYTLGVGYGFR